MVDSKIYTGQFSSRDGVVWTVDIYRSFIDGTALPAVGDLVFPDDTPLRIEWTEVSKLDPIQSSTATLVLISTSDRKYVDLYTTAAGSVWIKVMRSGSLYWTGSLDTELYEEPYSYATGYEVTLTFCDFAIMDRWKFVASARYLRFGAIIHGAMMAISSNISGMLPLGNLPQKCFSATGIYVSDVQTCRFVTAFYDTANYTDEDGEAMTYRKVIEEILRSWCLRMVQRNGVIWLFDLHSLYKSSTGYLLSSTEVSAGSASLPSATLIQWKGTDAVLSMDEVYNNVVVTFSPYGTATIMNDSIDKSIFTENQQIEVYENYKLAGLTAATDVSLYLRTYRGTNVSDYTIADYNLFNGAYIVQLIPELHGSECVFFTTSDGLSALNAWNTYDDSYGASGNAISTNEQAVECINYNEECSVHPSGQKIFRHIVSISSPSVPASLKIELPMLYSWRYNPFSDYTSSYSGEKYNFSSLHSSSFATNLSAIRVPIDLEILDASGVVTHHLGVSADGETEWISGTSWLWAAYVQYFSEESLKCTKPCVDESWQTNKCNDVNNRYYAKDGLYTPLPPCDGDYRIRITVYGEYAVAWGASSNKWTRFNVGIDNSNILAWMWRCYQFPKITAVKSNGVSLPDGDVEDSACLNENAEEILAIETIHDVVDKKSSLRCVTGRGRIHGQNKQYIRPYAYRIDDTDRYSLAQLLIGTAYSQYATPKKILSGTIELIPEFGVRTENQYPNEKYIMLSEVQTLREDVAEIKLCEFTEDRYKMEM